MSGRNRKIALALLVTALVALTITSVTAASQPPTSLPETSLSPASFSASSSFAEDNPLAEEPSLVALHPKETLSSNALSDVRAVESKAALDASLATAMKTTRLEGNPIPMLAHGAVPTAGPGPGDPGDPGPGCDPWLIEEAHDTVENNAPALEGLTGDVVADISVGDLDAVEAAYAPDEEPLDPLGTRWPPLTDTEPLTTVNVFLHDGDLVYFTYALVTWTDAGLGSEHTVCIPLRFIDGAWYLTTIDDTTDGLQFVTSVRL